MFITVSGNCMEMSAITLTITTVARIDSWGGGAENLGGLLQ